MLIYATEMRSYIKGASLRWRVWLGFGLIDAIFFTVKDLYGNSRSGEKFDVLWFCMGASLTMLSIWMAATALGVGLGKVLNQYIVFGLDFPILAMFATMLVGAVSRFRHVVAVSLAGVSAIYFRDLPYNAGLMVSAFIGASAGVMFQHLDSTSLYLKLIALGAIIYLLSVLPLLVFSGKELPAAIKPWLEYLTPSILAAMIFPSLFVRAHDSRLPHVSPSHLAGVLATGMAFYFFRKRVVSLLLGVTVFYLVHAYVKS